MTCPDCRPLAIRVVLTDCKVYDYYHGPTA